MKNSAVKAMICNQFNIKDKSLVNVEFLFSDVDGYHFEAWWVDSKEIHHQVNCVLPHLELKKRSLAFK